MPGKELINKRLNGNSDTEVYILYHTYIYGTMVLGVPEFKMSVLSLTIVRFLPPFPLFSPLAMHTCFPLKLKKEIIRKYFSVSVNDFFKFWL